MESYSTAAAEYQTLATLATLHGLPEDVAFNTPRRSFAQRAEMLRDDNPHHTTGSGARRRSSFEHQLDRSDDLTTYAPLQGHTVILETGHGKRRRKHKVEVWQLLYDARSSTQRWVRVYVRRITEGLEWLARNHPRELGWALPLSKKRAARIESATRFYLPRNNWPTFYQYRRVYDLVVRLVLTLRDYIERATAAPSRDERRALAGSAAAPEKVIPLPRVASPKPKAEEKPREDEHSDQAGTGCRDHAESWETIAARVGRRFFTK